MSAYRIVQEGLTNALRHAPGAAVRVDVAWRTDVVELRVGNDGGPVEDPAPGNGLTGMRERVALFGGRLRYGPRAQGGFEVTATLPLAGVPAEATR